MEKNENNKTVEDPTKSLWEEFFYSFDEHLSLHVKIYILLPKSDQEP